MFLVRIGLIKIDYSLIILFLIGLLIGALLFGLIFIFIKLFNKNKNYIIKSKEKVSNDMGVKLVNEALLEFDKRISDETISPFEECKNISLELMNDIAYLFFPNSKKPLFELSVDEIIDLTRVIGDNILERLNSSKITNYLKDKLTISFLFDLSIPKEEIIESPIIELKTNLFSKLGNAIKSGIKNIATSTINFAVKRLNVTKWVSRLIIKTIGEETFKVFYLKIYNENSNLETDFLDIDNLVEE